MATNLLFDSGYKECSLSFFNWSIADLQYRVNFCCKTKWVFYIYIHTHTLLHVFFSIMIYQGILNTVPCAVQLDLVVYPFHSTGKNLHLLIPYPTPPSVRSNTYTVQEMDEVEDRNRVACPASPCFLLSLGKNIPSLQSKGAWDSSLIPNQLLTVDL